MIGVFILLGGILAFVSIVGTLDLIAQHHDRKRASRYEKPT